MPDDSTPHGGEAMHPLPDRAKIPQPKPGKHQAEADGARPQGTDDEADRMPMRERPTLPEDPEITAADVARPAPPRDDKPMQPDIDKDTGMPSPVRQPAN